MNLKIGDIVEIKRLKQKLVGRVRKIEYKKYFGGNKPKSWIEHEVYVDTNSKYRIDNVVFYFPFELKVIRRMNTK